VRGADVTDKPRHRWGPKVVVSPYKSERECLNGCGIVKATRYEDNRWWNEFWRGLDKISAIKTPACEPVREGVPA
jgi:hypothetical protein